MILASGSMQSGGVEPAQPSEARVRRIDGLEGLPLPPVAFSRTFLAQGRDLGGDGTMVVPRSSLYDAQDRRGERSCGIMTAALPDASKYTSASEASTARSAAGTNYTSSEGRVHLPREEASSAFNFEGTRSVLGRCCPVAQQLTNHKEQEEDKFTEARLASQVQDECLASRYPLRMCSSILRNPAPTPKARSCMRAVSPMVMRNSRKRRSAQQHTMRWKAFFPRFRLLFLHHHLRLPQDF